MKILPECVVVAMSMVELCDKTLYQSLLYNIEHGLEPKPIPLHMPTNEELDEELNDSEP